MVKGGVVQLVERMLCTHEVIGSSPIISTVYPLRDTQNLLHAEHSLL